MIDWANTTDKYVIHDKYDCIICYIISVKNQQVRCKLVKYRTISLINKIYHCDCDSFDKDWRIMSDLDKIKYL